MKRVSNPAVRKKDSRCVSREITIVVDPGLAQARGNTSDQSNERIFRQFFD